jgi:hypothetical protein
MPVDKTLMGQGICIGVGRVHFQLIASNKSIQTDLNEMFQGVLLPHQDADIRVQFVIIKNNDNISVECNGATCFSVAEYSQFMPRLMDLLQIMAYQSQPYLLTVQRRVFRLSSILVHRSHLL